MSALARNMTYYNLAGEFIMDHYGLLLVRELEVLRTPDVQHPSVSVGPPYKMRLIRPYINGERCRVLPYQISRQEMRLMV